MPIQLLATGNGRSVVRWDDHPIVEDEPLFDYADEKTARTVNDKVARINEQYIQKGRHTQNKKQFKKVEGTDFFAIKGSRYHRLFGIYSGNRFVIVLNYVKRGNRIPRKVKSSANERIRRFHESGE